MNFDKATRTFCALSLGLIAGSFAACAGSDTPVVDDDLEGLIAERYGNGTAVAGTSSGGSAGRGGASSGGSGGARPAGGTGGGTSSGGSGGAAPAGGSGGSGSSTEVCDGFAILELKCNGGSCHGEGAVSGNFAESREIAEGLVGAEPFTAACADDGPLMDPEDPANSLLIRKLDEDPPCNNRMPLVGGFLEEADVTCLEEWIGSL